MSVVRFFFLHLGGLRRGEESGWGLGFTRRRTPQFCPLGRRRLAGRIRPMREGEITARAQVGRPARSRALKAGRGPFWAVSATSSTLIFSLVYLLLCSNVFTLLFIHLLIDLG